MWGGGGMGEVSGRIKALPEYQTRNKRIFVEDKFKEIRNFARAFRLSLLRTFKGCIGKYLRVKAARYSKPEPERNIAKPINAARERREQKGEGNFLSHSAYSHHVPVHAG